MRWSRWLLCLSVLSALAAGWKALAARPLNGRDLGATPVSSVIFPPQRIPLRFSHAQHLRATGVDCEVCHHRIDQSRSSLDNNLPQERQCATCHAIDRSEPDRQVAPGQPPARCVACHPGYRAGQAVERVAIPAPNIKFNHQAHRERGVACQDCHGDLLAEGIGLATRDQLPKMSLCLACHDDRRAPSRCTTCHLAGPSGRMQTDYPEGVLAPSGGLRGDAHDLTFRDDHAEVAKLDQRYCANCHGKAFCINCHNGAIKPLDFHGNDYLALHTIDVRRNSSDCTACHRLQSFCVGCHSRVGVAADNKGSEFLPPSSGDLSRRYHPSGWVEFSGGNLVQGPDSRSPQHHSFEAQRNIRQCAACHREQFCVTCHSAEPGNPFRVNPHPAGWAGSWRCRALARKAGRMCLRCHVDLAEVSCNL
jgi:hypothetical protein